MARPCQALSDEAHWVFREASRLATGDEPGRSSKLTKRRIEERTGFSPTEALELAREIAMENLISLSEYEQEGHIVFRSDFRCTCPGLNAPYVVARPSSREGLRVQARSSSYSYSYLAELATASEVDGSPSGNHQRPAGATGKRRGGTGRNTRSNSDPSQWTAHMLAEHFCDETVSKFFGKLIEPNNFKALRGKISLWKHSGVESVVIKSMIDIFVSDSTNLMKGIPAWKAFLAQRQRLLEAAEHLERQKSLQQPDVERWSRSGRSAAPTPDLARWSRV